MELDVSGKRFTKFFPTIPYELSAGGYIDVGDGTPYGHRYQKAFVCFANKPFNEVTDILLEELENNYRILSKWSINFLKIVGKKATKKVGHIILDEVSCGRLIDEEVVRWVNY